ncbi:hypothetical protein [Spongiactinospora gelatinilytica]|uniref:hypothetical protein n=1 Tax=Spongiactinospora gelatinilytica TaxID=2666298 RepID=UPI001314CACF|nr:hypothetical protein [Spongiactinospora gelatinilytica]
MTAKMFDIPRRGLAGLAALVTLAAVIMLAAMADSTTWFAPGAAYLLTLPALVCALGAAVAVLLRGPAWARVAAATAGPAWPPCCCPRWPATSSTGWGWRWAGRARCSSRCTG